MDTRKEGRHWSTCSCHLSQSSAIPGMCEHSMAGHGTPWPQPQETDCQAMAPQPCSQEARPSPCLRLPLLLCYSPAMAPRDKRRMWRFVAWESSTPVNLGAPGTHFMSGTIVQTHRLNGSSTDVSQSPRKQGLVLPEPLF